MSLNIFVVDKSNYLMHIYLQLNALHYALK